MRTRVKSGAILPAAALAATLFGLTVPARAQLSPTPSWSASAFQGRFGHSVASAGDVNNDGYDDLIVGGHLYTGGSNPEDEDEGRAWLYLGGPAGLGGAVWTWEPNNRTAYFGFSVDSAGDVNGDGYDDVIVGAPRYMTDGGFFGGGGFVFHGSASGLSTTPDWIYEETQAIANFGVPVSKAGDVNGDGYGDVIVAAARRDRHPDSETTDEGRVYVFYGSSSGLPSTPSLILDGEQDRGNFGFDIGDAGDVNGDGYDDVVISEVHANGGVTVPDITGKVMLYLGGPGGLSSSPAWVELGIEPFDRFGYSVSGAGDVNGDGYDDIVIGAISCCFNGSRTGRAFVYLGSASGLAPEPVWEHVEPGTTWFGFSVDRAGDVNNDGYDDIIVSDELYSAGGETGRAWVYLGAPGGVKFTAAWTDAQSSSSYGVEVSTAGDVNDDGFSDIVVGADTGARVYAYYGEETLEEEFFVDFTWSPRDAAAKKPIQFINLSTGKDPIFEWDFNADQIPDSSVASPIYTYAASGVATVTLRVRSETTSETGSVTKTIPLGEPVRVTRVDRQYSGFFLEGFDIDNRFDVFVDWGGPPGTVAFSVDGGAPLLVPGNAQGASKTYNIADDFAASFTPSILRMTPANGDGLIGQPHAESLYVFPFPGWFNLELVGNNAAFQIEGSEIIFDLMFDFPRKHLCEDDCLFDIPDVVPYISGEWGFQETFAEVGARISSRGVGSAFLRGTSGIKVMDVEVFGEAEGAAGHKLGPPSGLTVDEASFHLFLQGEVEKEVGIIDAIPALSPIADVPGLGWLNEKVEIEGSVLPSLDFTATWESDGDRLVFQDATGELELTLRAALEVKLLKDRLELEAWVGGKGGFTLGFPEPFFRSAQIGVELGVEYEVDALFIVEEGELICQVECTWVPGVSLNCPASCDATNDPPTESVRITLNEIDYAAYGPVSALVGAPLQSTGSAPGAAFLRTFNESSSAIPGSVQQELVISNLFPGASPALMSVGGGRLLVWAHQNPGFQIEQSTDIRWSYDDGSGWSAQGTLAADNQAELTPVAGVDTTGKAVAAWLRVADPFFTTPITTAADLPLFYKELEVVSAVFDPSTQSWSTPLALTADTAMDTNLELIDDGAGNLMLVWLSNPEGEFLSSAAHPSTLMFSTWDAVSQMWSAPAAAATGLIGVVEASAATKGTEALVIVTRDPNPTVSADTVLDIVTWNGSTWSAPAPFATGGNDNRHPVAAYDGAGTGHVIWLQDDNLVHATLAQPLPTILRPSSNNFGFADMQLQADPAGRLALLWQQPAAGNAANLYAMIYDPVSQIWSVDRRLTEEEEVKHYDVNAHFDAGGVLNAAYLASYIERVSKAVDLEGTMTTLENIPQDTFTDLRVFRHTLITDLAVNDRDLAVDPPRPQPGESVGASLTVHNAGDFPVNGFDVELFVGDPLGGGTLVGTDTVVGPFVAGDTRVVSFGYVQPETAGDVVAIVDPGNLIAEHDETNNTATVYLTNRDPVAIVAADLTSGPPPLSVQLDGLDSFDPDLEPITMSWSFGDGSPVVTNGFALHTFDAPGNYPVVLTVFDPRGGIDSATLEIEVTGGAGSLPDGATLGGDLLSAQREAGGDVTLSWNSASACGAGAGDYTVYEGSLGGSFSDHIPVTCSTAGATSHTFAPSAGDAYYLVVPANGTWEGSYGLNGQGYERPASASACLPQGIGRCVTCGNGLIDPGEVCEPSDLGGASCTSLGFDDGTLACGMTCQAFDTSGCFYDGCGNGIVDAGELCDGVDLAGATCASEGFASGTLACNAACDALDTSGCFVCGNSICETGGGEDCLSCPADCNGVQGGNPANRYCCGDGDGENAIFCEDARCEVSGNTCTVEATLPTAGLVLHLESDLGLSVDTGGAVIRWSDVSGQGNYLVPGSNTLPGDGPTRLAAATNGRDAVHFDGVDDKLERLLPLNGLAAGNANRTLFLVASYAGTGWGGFAYGNAGCSQLFGLVVDPGGFLTLQGWCPGSDFISASPGTGAGWLVQSARLEADVFTHFLNGAVIDQQTFTFNTVLDRMVLGAEVDSDPFVQMDAAAVLVYDRALGELDRLQVETYLQEKYLGVTP